MPVLKYEDAPAFEIRFPGTPNEAHPLLIYANGRTEGIGVEPRIIINRIPILVAQAEERAEARVRRGLLALAVITMTFMVGALAVLLAMRWLVISIK